MNPFKGLIDEELKLFEVRLDEVMVADVDLAHDIARYMSTLKGKRLRPALALLSAQATGLKDSQRIIEAAVAVEMIHAATMVHDDGVNDEKFGKQQFSQNIRVSP